MITHEKMEEQPSKRRCIMKFQEYAIDRIPSMEDKSGMSYKEYQKEAILRMIQNTDTFGHIGHILAFQMGLGKTLTFAGYMLLRRGYQEDVLGKTPRVDLLIVPNNVISHWMKELTRLDPNIRVFIYHGEKRKEVLKSLLSSKKKQRPHVVISTYYSLITGELDHYKWGIIALDEAHKIRNGRETIFRSPSKTALGAYRISSQGEICHAITGTPYQNNSFDVKSIEKFVGYEKYLWEYEILNLYGDKPPPPSFVETFVIQKTKDGLMRPIEFRTIEIPKPPKEDLKAYDAVKKQYNTLLSESRRNQGPDGRRKANLAMQLFTKMRVFCNLGRFNFYPKSPRKEDDIAAADDGEEMLSFYDTSPKIRAVMDEIPEALHKDSEKRLIIFSNFVITLEVLQANLQHRHPHIMTLMYTGKLNRLERDSIIDQFTNIEVKDIPMILLISIGSGNCGLNLTPCSSVFIVDACMNPFEQLQAINRVDRITQKYSVNVTKFVIQGMVEDVIYKGHEKKFTEAKSEGILLL